MAHQRIGDDPWLLDADEMSGAATNITVDRGIAAAITSACAGGIATSSRPAMMSVGARISPSAPVRSRSARSSASRAYEEGSVERNMLPAHETTSVCDRAKAGVNHRPIAASAIASSPSRSTTAARSFQKPAASSRADVLQTASRRTRSGKPEATCSPTMPPNESPQNEKRRTPSRSSSAMTSCARSATVHRPPVRGDDP